MARGCSLLGFLVRRVLAAGIAELAELEPARGGLLVLGRRVVAVLAIGALQCDDLAHCVCSPNVASHLGWQAAWQIEPEPTAPAHPTRRDAGHTAPAAES